MQKEDLEKFLGIESNVANLNLLIKCETQKHI
jgi:hypothetical protein